MVATQNPMDLDYRALGNAGLWCVGRLQTDADRERVVDGLSRGGNDNPGKRETLCGEVDDVIAARDWLAQQDGVDPERIYLGGHSTGGTLALLVAETTDKFRAVFAFGPVANAQSYGDDPSVLGDAREARLRSPVRYLATIRTPTFVIEGSDSPNASEVGRLERAAGAAPVTAFTVKGESHFSVLSPSRSSSRGRYSWTRSS